IEAAEEALKHVRSGAIIMARFDKGFPNEKHLLYFEDYRDPDTGFPKEIPYVGKLKLYNNLVKKGLKKRWCRVYEGTKIIEWTEIDHKAQTWSKSRRVVLIRMAEASEIEELFLSEEFIWQYQTLVTNMDDSGDEIWRFYNGRASMENCIKESKNGFGSDQVSGFAHSAYTIARFRRTFFEIPAKLVTHARQWKLKLNDTFTKFPEWLKMLKRVHQLE